MTEQDLIAVLQESETITAEFYPAEVVVPPVLKERTITANGYYPAATDEADGYSSVTVVVPDREVIKRELNVTPSTVTQTISVPSGVDGFDPVNVSAVTSDIDPNIIPKNIKSGVSILGVNGSSEEVNTVALSVTPQTYVMRSYPQSPYNGFSSVEVDAVTSSIDANIRPENIKSGVNILGVTGNVTVPSCYRVFDVSQNKIINSRNTPWMLLPADVTDVGDYCFYYAYENGRTNIVKGTIDLSGLTRISGSRAFSYCFSHCYGITGVDFSSLEEISGSYALASCFVASGLTSVSFPSLTTISGSQGINAAFNGNTNLVSADFSALVSITGTSAMGTTFFRCTSLTSVNFNSLSDLTASSAFSQCFYGCTALKTLSFPSLTSQSFGTRTSQFDSMLYDCSDVTVHFPSNLQSVIELWSSVTKGFGGTNTTVLFDLPATE